MTNDLKQNANAYQCEARNFN